MKTLVVLLVAGLAGCSGAAIPVESPVSSSRSNQCVWHFTAPADTSDSDETEGVSVCDDQQLSLSDNRINIRVDRSGNVSVGDCIARSTEINQDSNFWFVDVSACGVVGMLGVNIR